MLQRSPEPQPPQDLPPPFHCRSTIWAVPPLFLVSGSAVLSISNTWGPSFSFCSDDGSESWLMAFQQPKLYWLWKIGVGSIAGNTDWLPYRANIPQLATSCAWLGVTCIFSEMEVSSSHHSPPISDLNHISELKFEKPCLRHARVCTACCTWHSI